MDSLNSCCRVEIDNSLISNAQNLLKNEEILLDEKSKIFLLLGNSVRLKIVKLFLHFEKMCVCDLSDVLKMKQSPISQHLRKLKDGAILDSKRDGMTVFYSLRGEMKESISKIIEG